ncbi:MAG: FG-GAP repeat domain-containing protein [Phycisphaerales bacterium]
MKNFLWFVAVGLFGVMIDSSTVFAQATVPTVYLERFTPLGVLLNDPHANPLELPVRHPSVVARSYGEVNYLNKYVLTGNNVFYPFHTSVNPPPVPQPLPMPIGDRLGYDVCGLFDVDGDGHNDWAETWYHAEPVSSLTGANRLSDDAVILPEFPNSATPAPSTVRALPAERVGFCRIISGLQVPGQSQRRIGPDIWGHADNARLSHEIAAIKDIDGDGCDEVIFGCNTTDGGRGSINVYAYSNKYNKDGSTDKRWVCIWRIVGMNPQSEIAYELEDFFADFNGDGRADIIASSVWWRPANGGERDILSPTGIPLNEPPRQRGGGWVFLTPPKELFQAIQASDYWPELLRNPPAQVGDPRVKAPLVMNECQASIIVHNPEIGSSGTSWSQPVGDLASAGDIDHDGIPDLVANAGYETSSSSDPRYGKRGVYLFLSFDGYIDGTSGSTLWPTHCTPSPCAYASLYTQLNPGGTAAVENPNFKQIMLVPKNADCVIIPDIEPVLKYDFHYIGSAIAGMDFNNGSETVNSGQPDMVLLQTCASNARYNKIKVLMDLWNRFDLDGSKRTEVTINSPLSPLVSTVGELALVNKDYDIGYDPVSGVVGSVVRNSAQESPSVIGIAVAGNTDGKGFRDCELAVMLSSGIWTDNPLNDFSWTQTLPNNYYPQAAGHQFNRGDTVVLDFPPPTGGSVPPAPVQLLRIAGEQNQVVDHRTVPIDQGFNGRLVSQGVSTNYLTTVISPGWDQDRDGRDDLVIGAAFFPALVTHVPDLANPSNPPVPVPKVMINEVEMTQPYFVDGGANYFILSPPAEPIAQHPMRLSLASLGNEGLISVARLRIVSTALVPAVQPFNQFAQSAVKWMPIGCSYEPPTGALAVSPLHYDEVTKLFTMDVDFPISAVLSNPDGCVRIETRWTDSANHPLCICGWTMTVLPPESKQ